MSNDDGSAAAEVIELDDQRPHMVGLSICGLCGHTTVTVVPAFDRVERIQAGFECASKDCGHMACVILPQSVVDLAPDLFSVLLAEHSTPTPDNG